VRLFRRKLVLLTGTSGAAIVDAVANESALVQKKKTNRYGNLSVDVSSNRNMVVSGIDDKAIEAWVAGVETGPNETSVACAVVAAPMELEAENCTQSSHIHSVDFSLSSWMMIDFSLEDRAAPPRAESWAGRPNHKATSRQEERQDEQRAAAIDASRLQQTKGNSSTTAGVSRLFATQVCPMRPRPMPSRMGVVHALTLPVACDSWCFFRASSSLRLASCLCQASCLPYAHS